MVIVYPMTEENMIYVIDTADPSFLRECAESVLFHEDFLVLSTTHISKGDLWRCSSTLGFVFSASMRVVARGASAVLIMCLCRIAGRHDESGAEVQKGGC